jgi:hypothetical protein
MTNYAFAGSNAESVNIFIDMYQITLKLFRSDIDFNGRFSLASYIMNMCAHYRWFYKKYYGITTKIYLIYTNDIMKYNVRDVSEYNQKNNHKFTYSLGVSKYVADNTDILNLLAKYFKDIYFVQSPYEPMAMISSIMEDNVSEGNTNPNIIISTSRLLFQVPAFQPRGVPTVLLYHQYAFDGTINAHIIDALNPILKYCEIGGLKYNQFAEHINPEFLSVIIALAGYNQRSLINLVRTDIIIKTLYRAIGDGLLYNSYTTDIDLIYNLFKNKLPVSATKETIENRFKAVDLIYNKNIYKFSSYGKDKEWNVNLYNPTEIQLLNQTKFKNYPIDLERL